MNNELTLILEFAIGSGSIALWQGDKQVGRVVSDNAAKRSEDALMQIDSLLRSLKRDASDIDSIVCSRGPGGYTGIRVGLSTALGLRRATGVDVYGYSTFDALLGEDANATTIAVLDAGRREYLVGTIETTKIIKRTQLVEYIEDNSITKIVAAVQDYKDLVSTSGNGIVEIDDASDNVTTLFFELHQNQKGRGSSVDPIYGRAFN